MQGGQKWRKEINWEDEITNFIDKKIQFFLN